MPNKKKVLIISAPVGGGHLATAKAIQSALSKRYGDRYEYELNDIFTDMRMIFTLDKIAVQVYSNSVRSLKSMPYKFFYQLAELNAPLVSKFFTTVLKDQLRQYLKRYRPDVIVSTFPVAGYALSRVMTDENRVPVICMVTDAGDVHKLWLIGEEEAVLVSTPDTIDYAITLGVPKAKLHYLGFPIDPQFFDLPPASEVRRQLGLADTTTVLVTGGGLGLSTKMYNLAKKLSTRKMPGQILYVCGNNPKLVSELNRMEHATPSQIFGYVTNMPELMAATDLIVGKAGWISLSEAMAARRPTLIMSVIPGQEEPNARFIEKQGVGRVIKDVGELADTVEAYLNDPAKLAEFAPAFDRLQLDRDASQKIAEFIIQRMESSESA